MTSQAEHQLTPEEHSSVVGGSTAGRRLACPGSYKLEQKLPPETEKEESDYAKEGTALHEAMAYIFENDVQTSELDEEIVGREFYGIVLDKDLVAEMIVPCMEFMDKLFDACEAEGGLEFEVETLCEMPGIPNAFGTSDFIGRTDKRTFIIDWKFGRGIPVPAATEVDGKKIPNPQLMFYARAAQFTMPDLFHKGDPDWRVELVIAQPGIPEDRGGGFKRHSVTMGDLEDYRMQLVAAIAEAMGGNPRIAEKSGKHCDFCRCKPICPTHTGPVLDLSKLAAIKPLEVEKTELMPDEEYAQLLANIMDMGEALDAIVREAQKQAVEFIEDGYDVPGWCLKPKRQGASKWKGDFKQIDGFLARKGLSVDDRRDVKNITPAAARKKIEMTERDENTWTERPPSSGYTLDRKENVANPVTFQNAAEIASKLKQISG